MTFLTLSSPFIFDIFIYISGNGNRSHCGHDLASHVQVEVQPMASQLSIDE